MAGLYTTLISFCQLRNIRASHDCFALFLLSLSMKGGRTLKYITIHIRIHFSRYVNEFKKRKFKNCSWQGAIAATSISGAHGTMLCEANIFKRLLIT